MKNGIILVAIGIVLILATLILSSGNHPKRTLLGNIQNMEIVIEEGVYVTEQGSYFGHYVGRVTIPTRYPLLVSLAVTVAGVAMILIRITSRPPK